MSARVAPRAAPASASLWSSISFCAIAAASASVRNWAMARLFQLWCRFTRRDLESGFSRVFAKISRAPFRGQFRPLAVIQPSFRCRKRPLRASAFRLRRHAAANSPVTPLGADGRTIQPQKRSGMSKILLRSAVVAAFVGVGSAAIAADVSGAGATFPYPIYAKWADSYKKETGFGLNYQSIGSGGGIKQIKANTVTFGATDAPLKAD